MGSSPPSLYVQYKVNNNKKRWSGGDVIELVFLDLCVAGCLLTAVTVLSVRRRWVFLFAKGWTCCPCTRSSVGQLLTWWVLWGMSFCLHCSSMLQYGKKLQLGYFCCLKSYDLEDDVLFHINSNIFIHGMEISGFLQTLFLWAVLPCQTMEQRCSSENWVLPAWNWWIFPLSVLACLIYRQHLCSSSCDPAFSLNVVLFSSGIVIFMARRWCLKWWVTVWICLEFSGLWPRWHHKAFIWALQSNVILNFKWRLCSCQHVPCKRLCRAASMFELLTFFPPQSSFIANTHRVGCRKWKSVSWFPGYQSSWVWLLTHYTLWVKGKASIVTGQGVVLPAKSLIISDIWEFSS